jgi:hypothetical protein
MSSIFLVLQLMLQLVCLGFLVHYLREKRLIRDFAIRAVGRNKDPIEVVLTLGGEIFHTYKACHSNPSFIPLPIFCELGATPGSILRKGGCCSDLTRLTIVSLDTLGFKAGSITVCTASGEARHCLLEVSVPKQNVLIDPTYGFYYANGLGEGIELSDLQSGMRPSFVSLPNSNKLSYPPGIYYEFDYCKTKTANWTKSRVRKTVYRVLFFVTQGAIDRVKQPPVLEWPQIVLATSITAGLFCVNLALLLFG